MHRDEKYDYVFKFVIIGDTGTGKSCLLHQFVDGKFRKGPTKHTIGVEFGSRAVTIGGKKIKLQIWDTAGQERFRSVTRSYYRGAAGALIVYDLTNRETFEHLKNWCHDSRLLASKDISIMLIGNKCDLKGDRSVKFLESSRFAQQQDCMFLETSALTGENVDEVFLKCARTVLNRIESGLIDPVTFAGISGENESGLSEKLNSNRRWICCNCCKKETQGSCC